MKILSKLGVLAALAGSLFLSSCATDGYVVEQPVEPVTHAPLPRMLMLTGYPANGFTAATGTFIKTAIMLGRVLTAFMCKAPGIVASVVMPGAEGIGDSFK